MRMVKKQRHPLEDAHDYYYKKLLAIGVYNPAVLSRMSTLELKNEYEYYYHNTPSIKRKKP